jgi:hypothetical protein
MLTQRTTIPNKGFMVQSTHFILYIMYSNVLILHIFLLCRIYKKKPCDGIANLHLFLGLLAWLQTISR